MKKKIDFNKNESPSVEITIQVRDKNGNPTGKTKSFGGDSWRDAQSWYQKQSPSKRKRKKKKKDKGDKK